MPICERLILLAKIGGATPAQIKRIICCGREDAEGISPEIRFAIHIWQETFDVTTVVNSNGAICMEEKEEAKRRLGKSPDLVDSLMLTYVAEEETQGAFVLLG